MRAYERGQAERQIEGYGDDTAGLDNLGSQLFFNKISQKNLVIQDLYVYLKKL